MPAKKRLHRLKDGFKDIFGLGSRGRSATSLPNTRQPSPSPPPQASTRSVTPLPGAAASSAQADGESHLIWPSTGTVPSNAIPAATVSMPPSLVPHSQPMAPTPVAPPNPTQTMTSNEETSVERMKSMVWPGLKALLKVVDASADVFPPLKSAVGGLNQCIEIFESASKGCKDYAELRSKLDSLLEDLSQYLDGPAGLTMTTSMKNLSIGINGELKLVQQKYGRGVVQRHTEALDDATEIMECYRRIQRHLERLALNANLSIWRLVDEQAMEARLLRLLPTMSAVYNSAESEDVKRGPCTPGTRTEELAKLRRWVRDGAAGDVYWMNGMAGTGKTTIAYSLCVELDQTAELGASFFCSRSIPECRNVKLILPAIAYQLARFSYPFQCALSRILKADPDVHTRVLRTQFESLLVKPLLEVKDALPVDFVVVIDALDECENESSVAQILDIFLAQTACSHLPVRFLLSSRPEPEIYTRMMTLVGHDTRSRLVLHDLDIKTVKHDIRTYLQAELKDVPLTDSQFAALVERSGVLFIFAATAARYLKDGLGWLDHNERLDTILGGSVLDDDEHGIDALYTAILNTVFKNRKFNSSNRSLVKMILDTVICAQEPMTLSALAGLLQRKDAEQIDGLLRPLCSVINIAETTGLVTTLHASFPDFMLEQRRSSTFHCDPTSNHRRLAKACFDLIKQNACQFNICGLKSSYLYDDQVANLSEPVIQAVSSELFYASQYWIDHLEPSERHSGPGEQLFDFLSERLLFWMEVLNVKKRMYLGPRIIQRAEAWSRVNNCSNETCEIAHDAWCFVTAYTSHAISQSTPHLYISMLPFWPESSPISEHYTKHFRRTFQVKGTAMSRRQLALLATWSFNNIPRSTHFSPDGSLIAFGIASSLHIVDASTGKTVVGPLEHDDSVTSVVFSPNSTLIASGCAGGLIRLWTAQSGRLVSSPITGHTNAIDSVSFSPDSTRIVTGAKDGTIRVWNIQTGHTILGPLECTASWDSHSVCFSADGTRIVSTSVGYKLQVWDAHSALLVVNLLGAHTGAISSVCFSPDSIRIASGSEDTTILVWSAQDGQLVGNPLKGHSGSVLSIAFSPDGQYIVSGSSDKTIRLWDLTSNPISTRILEGHTAPVTSVAFSSDGSRIVSCSHDKTIRVWDARSRATVADSLEGHTGTVLSVGFSLDGKHIVSGSGDKTIRMWDAESGQMVGGPLEGHTGRVRSVCFSPDGRCIVSGSDDRTIRAWDVQSGQTVVGPLEGHTNWIRSVCLSPDGALIASGSADRTIRVWDARDGRPVGSPLEGHAGYVWSVCFSPDSKHIASGSDDKTILVRDMKSGKTVAGPLKGHAGSVFSVYFSPDGTRLASGSKDQTVRVWDAQQGQAILGPLEGHTEAIYSVCFSPNGSLIVSGSNDKTVRLWDARSGQAVGDPLVGHTAQVWSVAFSPDGKHIVSGSVDQTIRVWDVDGILRMYGAADSLPSPGPAPISPPRLHESWVLREDGWVVDSEDRLLAWVPPDLHTFLLWPRNPLLISARGSLQIDFEPATLGESWAECYQPPSS